MVAYALNVAKGIYSCEESSTYEEVVSFEQLDVKNAFLHGELEKDICMQQPKGFVVSSKDDYACLFKKSLQGLKQSPSQWLKRFGSFIISHNFRRYTFDICIYFKRYDDEFVCISTLVCE